MPGIILLAVFFRRKIFYRTETKLQITFTTLSTVFLVLTQNP